MNTGNNQNNNYSARPADKTIVEGGGSLPGATPLAGGSRINLSSPGIADSYAGGRRPYADDLPSGREPLPLGSGVIVGLLGSGGMARVYKIWNEKLEVFRAVKILIPSQQSDLRERFETEAKITAKLHHPNIVEIYNVGEFNSLPYLEMELVEGESLESVLARHGRLPDPVCSAIGIFIARALCYAHGHEFLLYGKTYHGIIHRDLKPANIMVSKQGAIKLMDFGIARPTETSLHTVEGNIVGTMQYLSPEQLDGVDVDCRADIYSFGTILYEMLTGAKTFPQETITNLMKMKIVNEYRKFSEFDFSVPESLAKITRRCLQNNKANRFPGAEVLARELQKAHDSLTSDTPEEILRIFGTDPSSIAAGRRKTLRFISLRTLLGALAGITVVAGLIAFFLLTGPSSTIKPANEASVSPLMQKTSPPRQAEPPAPPAHESTIPSASRAPEPPVREKTVPAASRPARVTPAPARKAIPAQKPPIDKVNTVYGKSDPVEIGYAAISARAFEDVITALENLPRNHPKYDIGTLLLLEAYIERNLTVKAERLLDRTSLTDAQFDLLYGRFLQRQGKDKLALDLYQSAMLKPSIAKNVSLVRQDALYHTAEIRSRHFQSNPSSDTRLQAINAWLAVKRQYSASTNHPRFKKANMELAQIQ